MIFCNVLIGVNGSTRGKIKTEEIKVIQTWEGVKILPRCYEVERLLLTGHAKEKYQHCNMVIHRKVLWLYKLNLL